MRCVLRSKLGRWLICKGLVLAIDRLPNFSVGSQGAYTCSIFVC